MARFTVRTLTLNPSIDVSSEAEKVEPEKKIRTCCERIDPGGGGINVARVLHRFGVDVEAIYFAGGATGRAFDELLDRAGLTRRRIEIADDTRTSLAIHDRSIGEDYRFVPEGPTIEGSEVAACLDAIDAADCDYFIASGSLPPGVPDDFYATAASKVARAGARFILDTSGAELSEALRGCGIFLLKASKEEFDPTSARQLVEKGCVQHVALTRGAAGAMLISADGALTLPSLDTEPVSTVGAGDSFLAGMVLGLTRGGTLSEALRVAVACGAAATLSPGTDIAYPVDVERLLPQVPQPQRLA